MIGNDLIFFPAWPRRSGSRLLRFRAKMFTAQEQGFIQAASQPYLAEAWLWSCKEAAYKVWFKTSHRREFAPKRFMVEGSRLDVQGLKLGQEARVRAFEQMYFLHSVLEGEYIHTLASDQSFAELRKVEIWRGHFRPESLDCQGRQIHIRKDEFQVPYGLLQNVRVDFSLSHDGVKTFCALKSRTMLTLDRYSAFSGLAKLI